MKCYHRSTRYIHYLSYEQKPAPWLAAAASDSYALGENATTSRKRFAGGSREDRK